MWCARHASVITFFRQASVITFFRQASVITFFRQAYVITFFRQAYVITVFRQAHNQKIGKPNNVKVFGSTKTKWPNRIAKYITCVELWHNNTTVEYPTVTVKCNTAQKAMFLNFNLCLSLKLHSLLCSLYPYHFSTIVKKRRWQ